MRRSVVLLVMLFATLWQSMALARVGSTVSALADMKHGALVEQGSEVVERVPIPDDLIPADARVEMDAKQAAGYFSNYLPDAQELAQPKGRGLEE